MIISNGLLITSNGIALIQGNRQTLEVVVQQLADDLSAAIAAKPLSEALDIAKLTKEVADARRDSNPLIGSIKIVGGIAVGAVATLAIVPILGVSATSTAGIAAGVAVGMIVDKAYDIVFDLVRANWGQIQTRTYPPGYIDMSVNERWNSCRIPPRRDPLAIDLDGDGIETQGIAASGSPILFDHDANGVRTGTGWVKADDAWLVLDRDGNGSIDSGRELFGVDTQITVTEALPGHTTATTYVRNARTGFEALRTLDTGNGSMGSSGHGDGIFDANDSGFSQVRLWQDLNQDGISQAGELGTLTAKGIASMA